jgi:hypothetical protein
MGHRLRRITADWDFKEPKKIQFYLKRCLSLLVGTDAELTIKKSTKKGYHIFLWSRCLGNIFELRKFIGDDINHLNMDMHHTHARQTLFFKKRKIQMKGVKQIKK